MLSQRKAIYIPELHSHHGQTKPVWYGGTSPIEYRPIYGQVPTVGEKPIKVSEPESGKLSDRKVMIEKSEQPKNPPKTLDECFYQKCDPFEEFELFGKTTI